MKRRLETIEKRLPDAANSADDAPCEAAAIDAAERILASLPGRYRRIVEDDISAGREWYGSGQRRLTAFVLEMAGRHAAGAYTGRLAFPESVCASAMDSYATCDRRGVAVSGDYAPSNDAAWGACESCGWRWWNRHIRDQLRRCPGCDEPLDMFVSNHERDVLAGNVTAWRPGQGPLPYGLVVPADKLEQTKAAIWRRAVAYYGHEGAEEWLSRLESQNSPGHLTNET